MKRKPTASPCGQRRTWPRSILPPLALLLRPAVARDVFHIRLSLLANPLPLVFAVGEADCRVKGVGWRRIAAEMGVGVGTLYQEAVLRGMLGASAQAESWGGGPVRRCGCWTLDSSSRSWRVCNRMARTTCFRGHVEMLGNLRDLPPARSRQQADMSIADSTMPKSSRSRASSSASVMLAISIDEPFRPLNSNACGGFPSTYERANSCWRALPAIAFLKHVLASNSAFDSPDGPTSASGSTLDAELRQPFPRVDS